MKEVPLTKEQREFAAERHGLVYAFLNERGLSEDDYYDVVIFGFLRAVKRYFTEPNLQKYAFSTIAWQAMQQSFSSHHRALSSQKRKGYTISLSSVAFGDEYLLLEEVLSVPDPLMAQLETELLLHDLAKRVSGQQMAVVRMKTAGYGVREIAKTQRTSMKTVKALLDDVYETLLAVCYG